MANKYVIGVLILVVLSASLYIMLPGKIRIDVQRTRTRYSVWEDKWVLAATEYVNLFDGTAKMRAKSRSLTYFNSSGIITISRQANYKDNISTFETFVFDSKISDIEQIPVSHTTTCSNCVGKILHFEYRDILYTGVTKKITSPFSFGHKMKLEWQDGSYLSKVYQQIISDKIIIRYKPKSNYESFEVRLFDPDTLLLDGVGDNRNYEYETTANLTSNVAHTTIHDNTGRYDNVSSNISYLIDTLRLNLTKANVSTAYNITIDTRDDLYRAEFNITSFEDVTNLTIEYPHLIHFPGVLMRNDLFQEKFIFDDIGYYRLNISFRSAETKIFYINYSAEGNLTDRDGHFNFSITAFDLDADNELDRGDIFQGNKNPNATENGTFTFASYTGLNQTYETFAVNNSNWIGGVVYDNSTGGCYVNELGGDTTCLIESDQFSTLYSTLFDYETLYKLSFQSVQYAHCGTRTWLEFSDLTNTVEIMKVEDADCKYGDAEVAACNFTMNKTDTKKWKYSRECEANSPNHCCGGNSKTGSGTIDVSSLSTPYYLRLRTDTTSGDAAVTGIFKNINYGGIHLNKTNVAFTGVNGPTNAEITGNYTNEVLNVTATNITRMTVTATTINPTGTNVTYYLSNDGGTTFEVVENGTSHLFTSVGNKPFVRFEFRTNSNQSSALVSRYNISIVKSALTNLSIDIGNDGSSDIDFGYELNSTSTPVSINESINDTVLNNYILDNCDNASHCLIPIGIISGSGGTIQIDDLNLTQNINPIVLNTSPIQDLSTIHLNVSGAVNFSDFKFDYRGSANISVSAGSVSRVIRVKYSPFNLTYPSGATGWEVFPSKRNQSDVEPYGQNSSDGIWRIKVDDVYHSEGVDLFVRYNESLDSCAVNRFVSRNWSDGYRGGEVLKEYFINGFEESGIAAYGIILLGQSFRIHSFSINLTRVGMQLAKANSPDNITVTINAVDSNNKPSGANLSFGYLNATEFNNATSGFRFFNMTNMILSIDTNYTIVLHVPYGSVSNNVVWVRNDTAIGEYYTDGQALKSTNGGLAWSVDNEKDFIFRIYGNQAGSQLNNTVNVTSSFIIENMTSDTDIWSYTDVNCSGSTPFLIPWFCFFSICSNCVRTVDYNDTCEWFE